MVVTSQQFCPHTSAVAKGKTSKALIANESKVKEKVAFVKHLESISSLVVYCTAEAFN